MKRRTGVFLIALFIATSSHLPAEPLGRAFTYQGRLSDNGVPAHGSYDLKFTLYDSAGGANVINAPLTNAAPSVSNGLFTVVLDFGPGAFSGEARWLELAVRTIGNPADFLTLSPRQPLTATPFARYAASAASAGTAAQVSAANISGRLADSQLSTNVALLNTSPNFAGTVTASSFAGRGALPWQEVTGTSQSAAPNTAYLANSPTQVVVTLPAAPVVGDIVRVSGLGAGGWRISQNAGQTILTENIGGIGTVWTPHESNRMWSCVASSADGARLAATVNDSMEGRIYLSADSGASWIASGPTQSWLSVACSADGAKLVAIPWYGQLHTSDDYGTNWTARGIVREWRSVASSADGAKLVAVPNASFILTSTNSGVTWTTIETNAWWNSVALSADGNIIYAAGSSPIQMSFDFGATWYAQGEWNSWSDIACSADGSKVFATAMYLHTSTNYGFGWTARGNNGSYRSIACSANGTRAVAVEGNGRIYTSADSGLTWTERVNGMYNWWTVASSADGAKLVATGNGMPIYTSVPTTTPGTAGYLAGGQGSEVQLQYIGNNQFRILNSEGAISVQGAVLPTGLASAQAGLQSLQAGLDTKVSKAGDTMTGPLINNAVFAGNGGGLTNLNMANLTGLLQGAQLANGTVTAPKLVTAVYPSLPAIFTNPTPAYSDHFGTAVAALGIDRVLIGAPNDDTGATDAGAAYLFSASGTLLTTFTNPTPASSDYFGDSVAALGSDRVLIGAYFDGAGAPGAGAAYLYNTNGTLVTTFTNPTPADSDTFGRALATLGNDRVLIGAYRDDTVATNAGAAYLFSTNGTLLTTFLNPTPADDDFFGFSVAAVGNDRVLIGAYRDDTGATNAGAAYLFSTNGTVLTTFFNPAPADDDYFGDSVAALGSNLVIIGAPTDDTGAPNAGVVYLFTTSGTLLTTLTNPTPAASELFGISVAAVGNDRVLVGASSAGAAYLFSTDGTLLATFNSPASNEEIGRSLATLGSDRILLGARFDDAGAPGAGAAYLFRMETFTPGLVADAVRSQSITTTSLADGAVTAAKLDPSIGVWTRSGTNVFRETGNVGVGTNSPDQKLVVAGNIYATGTITPNSDRNLKTGFEPVDAAAILERVSQLSIQQWRFKSEAEGVNHVGPMAQDFRAAFGLGEIPTAIATVDADGIALAAIQGLNEKLTEELKRRDAENAELKQRLERLERLLIRPCGGAN